MEHDGITEEDEITVAVMSVMAAGITVIECYICKESLPREPRNYRIHARNVYLNRLLQGNDTTSISMVRMNKLSFFNLCSILRTRGLLKDAMEVSVEEQVLMFLHTIGHNQRNRVIGHNFLRSGETVSRYFHQVLNAIGELQSEYIRPPSTSVSPYIARRPKLFPYFKDCVGPLDGTHIHASVPAEMVAAFRSRKGYPTQNVLATIDFDLRFTYVLAGWEGSAHDALVLRDALQRPNGLKIPEGKYYLVDAGYANKPGFLSPYRGVRYHLKEWGSRTPATPKELFNYRHSSARTSVERAFGSLKNRFKILTSRPFFPLTTQIDLVIACCVLHNYIVSGSGDGLIPTEEEWIPQSSSNRTQTEQREDAREWNENRDKTAQDMWDHE